MSDTIYCLGCRAEHSIVQVGTAGGVISVVSCPKVKVAPSYAPTKGPKVIRVDTRKKP